MYRTYWEFVSVLENIMHLEQRRLTMNGEAAMQANLGVECEIFYAEMRMVVAGSSYRQKIYTSKMQ